MESLLLHRYSLALSATLCTTVTMWCVFHVDYTAFVTHTQDSNVSTPSGSAPNSQPSLSSIISHFPVGLTRDVRTQTVSLCSLYLQQTHHATTADAST